MFISQIFQLNYLQSFYIYLKYFHLFHPSSCTIYAEFSIIQISILIVKEFYADKARNKHKLIRELRKLKTSTNQAELSKETIEKLMAML